MQRQLRGKHLLPDIQRRKVVADQCHHHVDGLLANDGKPFRLGLVLQRGTEFRCQRLPHGLQVIPRIESSRDLADRLAQRLKVTEIGGAGQNVDLCAGIVDVVFARHFVAAGREKLCQRIAKDRAADVADMERPRRVGGHIFDVRLLAAT